MRKYENLLTLYFFGMVFATCYQYVYTIWFPIKVVSLGMLVCIIKDRNQRYSGVSGIATKMLSVFFIIMLISNTVGINLPKEYATELSQISRMLNQSYTYLSSFIILFFGRLLEPGFVKRFFPKYCIAIEVAIIIGIIHFLCLKAGIEFMPILRQNGSINEGASVTAQFGSEVVTRIYGFAGEPKNLGFLVLPYLLISIITFNDGYIRNNKFYHIAFMILGLFVLINTYSSAALMNFAIAVPIIMIFFATHQTFFRIVSILIIVVFALSLISVRDTPRDNNPSFIESFYDRTFGRAEDEMENDRQESVVLDAFKNSEKLIHLVGWGVAQYTFHVEDQTIGNALIPLQSGLILTLSDFGIIGIIYLVFLFVLILDLLRKSKYSFNMYSLSFSIATLSTFIGSMMYGMLVNCFIYIMLAFYAYHDEDDYIIEDF